MNAVPKLVASRTLTDTGAWANSRPVNGADRGRRPAASARTREVPFRC
jgi:hypothetical protein